MGVTVKKEKNLNQLKNESEKASSEQIDDIFAQISTLGGNPSQKIDRPVESEEPVIRHGTRTASPKAREEKPGYISLVIPNNLKTKWKTYSLEHGMSLTDCIKLGMKLLEEMETQEMLKIEDGVVTILN